MTDESGSAGKNSENASIEKNDQKNTDNQEPDVQIVEDTVLKIFQLNLNQ